MSQQQDIKMNVEAGTVVGVEKEEKKQRRPRKKDDKKGKESESVLSSITKLQSLVASISISDPKVLSDLKEQTEQIKSGVEHIVQSHQPVKVKHTRDPANTGLGMKRAITPDLAKFLGCEYDALKSRIDVTSAICNYAKINGLGNPDNRKQIKPDSILRDLLRLSPEKEFYAYTDIQSHLNHLFTEQPSLYIQEPLRVFVRENKISQWSPEWNENELVSWNDVKLYFSEYIQFHSLKDEADKKKVNLDDKLIALFSIEPTRDRKITRNLFFNKYCNQLVTKAT